MAKKITKTVKLNILPLTNRKEQMLSNLEKNWLDATDHLSETLRYWDVFDLPLTRFNLHKLEYKHIRKEFGLQSQLVVDAIKDAFASWKNNGRNGIDTASVSFNIPRSGSFRETERGNPVVSIVTLEDRIGLPIPQDGAWNRFYEFLANGWRTTHFRIKRNCNGWQLLVSIFRDFDIKGEYDAVIGIDVGSRTLASVSILDKEAKILKQLYFGRDIWEKQRNISIRRSKLQNLVKKGRDKDKARRKLRELKGYETNFVKTRCYEVANEIVRLAKEYNAFIAIEDLNGLAKSRLHRKANRRVKRMPHYQFRVALEQVSGENNTAVVAGNPYRTSQRCSKCGNIHKTSDVVFKCPSCGFECNRDRNASVNIAHVAGGFSEAMITTSQSSMGNGSVNSHAWKDDGVLGSCLQHAQPSNFKPLISMSGS